MVLCTGMENLLSQNVHLSWTFQVFLGVPPGMQSEPGLSFIDIGLEFTRFPSGSFGCCRIPSAWERPDLFAGLEGWTNQRRRKAPPVVLPKHRGNWGFLYIVKRLRAVSFVIPYSSWHTFLVLAFQTTDGSHLESVGFFYRSNSMWNLFSEPKQLRQTKDAAYLIVLYSPFNVEGCGCVACLRKGLVFSPCGARARTSLRFGFCCFCVTPACTSLWKKQCQEPGNKVVSHFGLISDKLDLDCAVAELLTNRSIKSILLLNSNFPHVLCVFIVRRNHLVWHLATSSFCQSLIVNQMGSILLPLVWIIFDLTGVCFSALF